ncbi:hypothetical protein G7Y89_g12768 [Cudoniella acicularis]|uniref:FAD dependent oxidoreductase domain-containing protein n=1 Tax=Cudoniella acicularis TaxID=354080 RepID=A0A8H4R8H6_9HELO|nr:hypothetical protein G7Y89_g12768 [Cudoniella acicularis]
MATDTSQPRNIVIIGGGIIGCTTAYFLTRHPAFNPAIHKITLIEAQSIASGASGKAGGLLALWAYPANIVPLSYRLHAELAKEHDGPKRWGYRTVHCGSVTAKGKLYDVGKKEAVVAGTDEWKKLPKTVKGKAPPVPTEIPKELDWFDHDTIKTYSVMGTPETTAQVHPYLFTTSMAELAVEKGVEVILGLVTALDYTGPNGIKGVTYEDKATKHIHTLSATDVVVAAGPWANHVFPEAPIEAIRAHSVVIKADVSANAVFTEIDLPKDFGIKDSSGTKRRKHGKTVNPELYARPDGTIYACGEGDYAVPLPKTSDLVVCDTSRCDDIHAYLSTISPTIRDSEVVAKQACYLPLVLSGGGPIIGETGIRGLLLASGHTCWGIQNGPATGKLMSEFIFEGGAKSAHIDSLDPQNVIQTILQMPLEFQNRMAHTIDTSIDTKLAPLARSAAAVQSKLNNLSGLQIASNELFIKNILETTQETSNTIRDHSLEVQAKTSSLHRSVDQMNTLIESVSYLLQGLTAAQQSPTFSRDTTEVQAAASGLWRGLWLIISSLYVLVRAFM